jgi:hypothetical protein
VAEALGVFFGVLIVGFFVVIAVAGLAASVGLVALMLVAGIRAVNRK